MDVTHVEYRHVPSELKCMRQWVGFMYVWNEKKGKRDKIPINPHTLWGAKSNDPATWGTFSEAVGALGKPSHCVGIRDGKRAYIDGNVDGIGFQFARGIFGVDLDHVAKDGVLTREAQEIVSSLDSYTEWSPSGDGLHILCKGTLPNGGRRRGCVEMYSEGRFFTVTGNVYGDMRKLEERTAQAADIHKRYIAGVTEGGNAPLATHDGNPEDEGIIRRAARGRRGARFLSLWNGDIGLYGGDHSRADQALVNDLAYWTNGNAQKVDALFRCSGLMRPKWDESRGALTYGERTIRKALETIRPVTKENPKAAPPQVKKQQSDSLGAYMRGSMLGDLSTFSAYAKRKTGFTNLDDISGGIYPGLYVVGGISSLGKTTFVQQIGDSLAACGEHVLFFSLEQTRMELGIKSLGRFMAKRDRNTAVTASQMRSGTVTPELRRAMGDFISIADRIHIVPCTRRLNMEFIKRYITDFIRAHSGVTPIVIIDYLQIIPDGAVRGGDKERIDSIVRGLKLLQAEYNLVMIAVSSVNRSNYLVPMDYESFKDCGGIEYTADVVWGLQYQAIHDDVFGYESRVREKRERMQEAKRADPRRIELVCLKNRFGISGYTCGFTYSPKYDLFDVDPGYGIPKETMKPVAFRR